MKRLKKLHSARRATQSREIWQGIVDYANADLTSDKDSFNNFQRLVFDCLNWPRLHFDGLSVIDELENYAERSGGTLEEALRFWAIQYQPDFRSLLTWLCVPDRRPDLGPEAVRLLHSMNEGINVSIDDANDKFHETLCPIYFFPRLQSCTSVLSPLCKFIVDRIEEFQEGDLTRTDAIPVRICDRAGCNRFKLPERQKDTCFCSDRCRSLHHQTKKPKEAKAENMRRYRRTVKARRKGVEETGGSQRRGGRG